MTRGQTKLKKMYYSKFKCVFIKLMERTVMQHYYGLSSCLCVCVIKHALSLRVSFFVYTVKNFSDYLWLLRMYRVSYCRLFFAGCAHKPTLADTGLHDQHSLQCLCTQIIIMFLGCFFLFFVFFTKVMFLKVKVLTKYHICYLKQSTLTVSWGEEQQGEEAQNT